MVGPEGRKIIFNEDTTQRARRLASALLPVPRLADADIEPLIQRHCDAQSLDPKLVRAVIQVESGYNVRARSNKGAVGLMQLMPETAADLAVADRYDPEQNLRGGTLYLRQMLDRFGRIDLALAAYNAGPSPVERYKGVPPWSDTVDYVNRVLALYQGAGGVADRDVIARYRPGHRPKPYVTRNSEGRIVVTTALGGSR
jgi:soluble lytic murein transglycosylase-like protein